LLALGRLRSTAKVHIQIEQRGADRCLLRKDLDTVIQAAVADRATDR